MGGRKCFWVNEDHESRRTRTKSHEEGNSERILESKPSFLTPFQRKAWKTLSYNNKHAEELLPWPHLGPLALSASHEHVLFFAIYLSPFLIFLEQVSQSRFRCIET